MTTLLLDDTTPALPALRDCLHERWAVILSHPQDFALGEHVPTGYMARVQRDLIAAEVMLLTTSERSNWLIALDQPEVVVRVGGSPEARVISFAERALRTHLLSITLPYAVVVDHQLRCRATIHYCSSHDVPQCLGELLEMVKALRGGEMRAGRGAHDAAARCTACSE